MKLTLQFALLCCVLLLAPCRGQDATTQPTSAEDASTESAEDGDSSESAEVTTQAMMTSPSDPCMDVRCENGGTCVPEADNYTCTCAPGYTGRNCSTGRCRNYLQYTTRNDNVILLYSYVILDAILAHCQSESWQAMDLLCHFHIFPWGEIRNKTRKNTGLLSSPL